MEKRKNPQLDIYRHSGLFFQVGLLVTLLLIVSAFEWRSRSDGPEVDISSWKGWEADPLIPVKFPEPKPPKPRKIPKPVPVTEDTKVTVEDLGLDQLDQKEVEIEEPPVFDGPIDEAVETVDIPDRKPMPEGGYEAFYKYISEEMKYPPLARQRQVEGKVFISFIVDEHGEMTNIAIARGIGSGCDEEVLRVLKDAPKWKPGWKDNRLVRVRMVLPITFKLH